VYGVLPANVVTVGLHVTTPAVKFAVPTLAVALGAAPVAGGVTVIAALVISVAVSANVYDSVTVTPVLSVTVAALPLIVAVVSVDANT